MHRWHLVKHAPWALFIGTLASFTALGCGGSNSPAQDPTGASTSTPANSGNTVDPASGTTDLNSASNSSTAPPGAPESLADPAGHPPIVSTGKSSGETPINSGAGNALPEHTH
jgi:hypothetical protein